MAIADIINTLKTESDKRYDNFKIEEVDTIKRIYEDSYLEKPTWLGGDKEFVCLFIDLDNSSKLSFKKHPKTMARIYDYYTQNIVEVLNQPGMQADYIDIKGDGAFGIYEGANAEFRALAAAMTFKTFFERAVRPKFQTDEHIINTKLAISKNLILVKRIGRRGERNNNEVWAGRVVNSASKLAGLSTEIFETHGNITVAPDKSSLLVISEKVYNDLLAKKDFAIFSCGHDMNGNHVGSKQSVWVEYVPKIAGNIDGDKVYYTSTLWCKLCGDKFVNELLK